MNRSELCNRVSELLSVKVHITVPSIETDLMETGLLDSLTLVELMTNLEEEFNIRISFDEIDLDNFRSVASIADYVNQRSEAKEPTVAF